MASLQRAAGSTVGLLPTAGMVVAGSLLATLTTDVARNNIYDIDMAGGDAVYPVAAAIALNVFTGGRTVRYLSIGMVSSSVTSALREMGVL